MSSHRSIDLLVIFSINQLIIESKTCGRMPSHCVVMPTYFVCWLPQFIKKLLFLSFSIELHQLKDFTIPLVNSRFICCLIFPVGLLYCTVFWYFVHTCMWRRDIQNILILYSILLNWSTLIWNFAVMCICKTQNPNTVMKYCDDTHTESREEGMEGKGRRGVEQRGEEFPHRQWLVLTRSIAYWQALLWALLCFNVITLSADI